MQRKERLPLEKVCINLFDGDMATLQELHPHMGAGRAIREIVRGHIDRAKASLTKKTEEAAA